MTFFQRLLFFKFTPSSGSVRFLGPRTPQSKFYGKFCDVGSMTTENRWKMAIFHQNLNLYPLRKVIIRKKSPGFS